MSLANRDYCPERNVQGTQEIECIEIKPVLFTQKKSGVCPISHRQQQNEQMDAQPHCIMFYILMGNVTVSRGYVHFLRSLRFICPMCTVSIS